MQKFITALTLLAAGSFSAWSQNTNTAAPTGKASSKTEAAAAGSSNITFTVTVIGTNPFSYQWTFNGTNLSKIGAAEARKHYDQTLVVTGKIAQVTFRPSIVFLNLDEAFPNSPFAAVVFSRATNQFGDLSKLKGKDVEITGKIKEYRNKPEIVLESTNQLMIVGKQAEPGGAEKK
jgi:DNA/RNA endonuclease YhcR with UshA esterase domain